MYWRGRGSDPKIQLEQTLSLYGSHQNFFLYRTNKNKPLTSQPDCNVFSIGSIRWTTQDHRNTIQVDIYCGNKQVCAELCRVLLCCTATHTEREKEREQKRNSLRVKLGIHHASGAEFINALVLKTHTHKHTPLNSKWVKTSQGTREGRQGGVKWETDGGRERKVIYPSRTFTPDQVCTALWMCVL